MVEDCPMIFKDGRKCGLHKGHGFHHVPENEVKDKELEEFVANLVHPALKKVKPKANPNAVYMLSTLPASERKQYPIATGVLDYFPDALAAVAAVSKAGNDQHNPGQPLHWAREKSTDHADCLMRHFIERGKIDTDGQRHSAKLVWRALALLQTEIEEALRNG